MENNKQNPSGLKPIFVIGTGPGSREYLTPAGADKIKEAEVIIGGRRLLDEYALPHQETFAIRNNLDEMLNFIKVNTGKKIAVLASGDPGMFGILNYLVKNLKEFPLEVIPGISSVQLVCARLRMSWHDAVFASAHGRDINNVVNIIKSSSKTIVLTDPKAHPALIAAALSEAGIRNKKVYLAVDLSYPTEKIMEFSLDNLKNEGNYGSCVMVIVDE